MAAIAESVSSSETELPVCLYPWAENPYRLVSLHEVLKFSAYSFIAIGTTIDHLAKTTELLGQQSETQEQLLDQYEGLLNFVENGCEAMGLGHTAGIMALIKDEHRQKTATRPLLNGDVYQSLKEINRSFIQELNGETFLHLQSENAGLFLKPQAYGQEVNDQFGSCRSDLWSAGNCFSVELYDACVFHLMRVLENGLRALAAKFVVSFDHKNWHNIIEEIEKKVRQIDGSWGSNWKLEQQKYSEAACQFMFFKDAWRNHVTHGRDTYDSSRTKMIWDAVGYFLRCLADIGLSDSTVP